MCARPKLYSATPLFVVPYSSGAGMRCGSVSDTFTSIVISGITLMRDGSSAIWRARRSRATCDMGAKRAVCGFFYRFFFAKYPFYPAARPGACERLAHECRASTRRLAR